MKYLYATIAFVLASAPATLAADWSVKFGPGIVDGELNYHTKRLSLRREETLLGAISWATEAGTYTDTVSPDRKGALTARLQLGITPGPETGFYGKAFSGVCAISQPDSQLGGRFPQFCTDYGIGLRDRYSFIGLGVEHISSAGIFYPNAGRNNMTVEAGLRF